MNILTIIDLYKTYGQGASPIHTLKYISSSLQKGEFAAVAGEPGSDKGTLLDYVGALDTPTNGYVTIDGCDLFTMKGEARIVFRRRNMGFVSQSFRLISKLIVEQNIVFPLLLDYQKPDPGVIEELLEMLGLTDRRSRLPSQLSGGQQQRAAIGRALITKPSLIPVGGPAENLDIKSSQDAMDLLTWIFRHYQQTILMTAHNLGPISPTDRVLKVNGGVLPDLGRMRLQNTIQN